MHMGLQIRIWLFVAVMLTYTPLVWSQRFVERTQFTVFTFEEFCHLFNGEKEEVSVVNIFPKLADTGRFEFIQHLFNPQDTLVDHVAITEFASYVVHWNKRISYDNTDSYAELVYTDAKKHDVPILARLQVRQSDNGPYWALQDIWGELFQVGDTSKVGYIGISSNEVGFQEFGQVAGGNPKQICGDEYRTDNRSIFLYLTANGMLKYAHTHRIFYRVRFDDYEMEIGHIIDEKQSVGGWVITGLSKSGKKII